MKQKKLFSRVLLLMTVAMGVSQAQAEETTIASWNKQKLEKNTAVTADGGDAANKGIATLTSSVNLSSAGTNAYYTSSASNAQIVFASLSLSSYSNINMTFYSRGSQKGTIAVSTSTDGTNYTSLTTTSAVTGSEKLFTVSNIPNSAKYIKLVYSSSTGSFYFGTPVIKGEAQLAHELTVTSNNEDYGTVSVSSNEIIATAKTGYRVSKSNPYTIISGSATIIQSGTSFFVTAETDLEIQINFESIPSHTATFSANGITHSSAVVDEDAAISFPATNPENLGDYTFVGWTTATINGKTNEAPALITSAVMEEADIEFYAVYAKASEGDAVEQLTQTLEYDTWTYSGNTKKMTASAGDYRLFGSGAYVESAAFDLSTLNKVIVYGGYYGGSSYVNLTIGDGTNTWKSVSVSGNSQTAANTFTSGTALSGTGKLRVTSNSGDGSSNGIRMSKIEIFCMVPSVVYSDYCTTVTESLLIGSLGFATFSANVPVNFAGSGVTAYTVKYANGSAQLTAVEQVPAGAGVIVEGAADTYELPLLETANALENNDLLVSDGTITGGDDIYCLADGNNGVGFYRVASTVTIPAGKAYLDVSAGARQFIGFNENLTGINAVSTEGAAGKGIYNLNGQRVAQPTKGLYIVNGKKTIVK